MSRELQAIGEEYRKDSNDSFVSVVRSVGEINKSLLGIASEMTEHSKRSVGRAFEMQAQLAKKAYETYISEITKLGQMVFAPGSLLGRQSDCPIQVSLKKGLALKADHDALPPTE